jgi:flagellar biosynthesis protein FlhF
MKQRLFRVTGTTLHEAHEAMRARFGDDAIVLNTRHIQQGGLLGYFAKAQVELTVSVVDAPAAPEGPAVTSALERRYRASSPAQSTATADSRKELEALLRTAQQRIQAQAPPPPPGMTTPSELPRATEAPAAAQRPQARPMRGEAEAMFASPAAAPVENMVQFPQPKPAEADSIEALKSELREIREMMQVLYAENPGAGLPTEFSPHYRELLAKGVSRKTAAALIGAVVRECEPAVLRDERIFRERLAFEIRRNVKVTGGIGLHGGSCRRVAFCGATGVGKTTNIAKLAGQFSGVRERARVALVTTDTYRIAAPEQLRVYANIIGLPMTVADDPAAVRRAVHEYRDYDLVLIDTAGGSQFNLEQINELKLVLQAAQPHETVLTVSAGTPLEDMRNVLRNFLCLDPTALMFTKVDETRQYGAMLSLLWESDLPLSYLSVGQNVPDDITVATGGKLAQLIAQGGAAHE